MNQEVVESRIEDRTLLCCATLDLYRTKGLLPSRLCLGLYLMEVKAPLLRIKIEQCILCTHEGDPRLYVDYFIRLCLEGEPYTDVIPTHLLSVGWIELVASMVMIPLSLYALHRWLLLPVATLRSTSANSDSEVLVEDSLRIVAERPHELTPYER